MCARNIATRRGGMGTTLTSLPRGAVDKVES
jgi:hypothetical protein